MTLTRPTGSLRTGPGGEALDLPQAGAAWVCVDLSVDTAHDRIELGLYDRSRLTSTEPGTTVTVGLGDAGEDIDVLTGEVAGVASGPAGATLVAYAQSRRLSHHHVGRGYVRQTVAQVVSDLLTDAGVDEGDVDAPQSLAAYHVDGALPVWCHLHRLAALVGCQITTRPDGAMSFTLAPGATPGGGLAVAATAAMAAVSALGGGGGLRTGVNVLAAHVGPTRAAPAAAVPVVRLGAASGLGESRWYHLVADPNPAGGVAQVSPSVRDQDLADAATVARTDAARRRQRTARLSVVGDPSLRAGAEITVDGIAWRALRVRHLLTHHSGYTCDLVLEGT